MLNTSADADRPATEYDDHPCKAGERHSDLGGRREDFAHFDHDRNIFRVRVPV
jgi:hypothetical protein